MVRATGSESDEKSVTGPTSERLSSVVRRKSGKSAKRISGTESRAPMQNEPKASRVPKNDLRSPGARAGFSASDCMALSSRRGAKILEALFFCHLAGVGDQALDGIRRQFRAEGGHFAFAFRNRVG